MDQNEPDETAADFSRSSIPAPSPCCRLTLMAQFDPEGAQVISYFPQLADGGSDAQRWTTSLTLVNSHGSLTALAIVNLYGNDGSPLSLDFGSGPASTFKATIPAQGSVTYRSLGTSPTTVIGWAVVVSTLPLEGVVQFSFSVNGVPQQGVSAQATPASTLFRSPATISTGSRLGISTPPRFPSQ